MFSLVSRAEASTRLEPCQALPGIPKGTSLDKATPEGAASPSLTSSAVLTKRRGVFLGLSRLRRQGPLQDGLGAGLMGKAKAWQWGLDFPTKLLDVPLPREGKILVFDFVLGLVCNCIPLHHRPQPRVTPPGCDQSERFMGVFRQNRQVAGAGEAL